MRDAGPTVGTEAVPALHADGTALALMHGARAALGRAIVAHASGDDARRAATAFDWWQCEQVKNVNAEKTEHPCQVPCAMVERIIEGIDATTVLDPFLGSGTTLVAAYRLGREACGIEISEEYCSLAAERLERELAQGRLFEPAEVAQPRQESLALEGAAK